MQSSKVDETRISERVERLKNDVQSSTPGICTERALIWTAAAKDPNLKNKPPVIRNAESLARVLSGKSVTIWPQELLVGNFSSRRVGGSIFPELHGVPVLEDLLIFPHRKTNPLEISRRDQWALAKIVPHWMFRFLSLRAWRQPWEIARFVVNQLRAIFYFVNETGGISHVAPDYATLCVQGTEGLKQDSLERQKSVAQDSESWNFYEGVKIIAEGLAVFGERYAAEARRLALTESDPLRREELQAIADCCSRVPRYPARTFREAIQSILFAQIAINLESLDNSVCPGRLDSILFPYYEQDLDSGSLDQSFAKELLACFSIKLSEIIPVFSRRISRVHGGMFNGQVVTVGGVDRDGHDMTNDLSMMLLDVMDSLRMRQPNFHARLHAGSPDAYRRKIAEILSRGANSPALYNDEVIIPVLAAKGYALADARDYTGVGCVEPVSQGKSFSSTDAALLNVPILLELALNQGHRFGSPIRAGVATKSLDLMRSMDDVQEAFDLQLSAMMKKLLRDLKAVETANRLYHPTPLTSMLLDGCMESGTCSTAGGATYNFSGIQCVGPADTGDALAAIEEIVFREKRMTLRELVASLKKNDMHHIMSSIPGDCPTFGNDDERADAWTRWVVDRYAETLSKEKNTRGGQYVPGLYSVTVHEHYGRVTGALPSGRSRGEPFASGISPRNGSDRNGPTAVLNSVNRLDVSQIANGVNFNLKFDTHCLRGEKGTLALNSLIKTYFRRGGMQIQINVCDPAVLLEARRDPTKYPHLLVRVSGYSAYFADLTPEMQDEIIRRTSFTIP